MNGDHLLSTLALWHDFRGARRFKRTSSVVSRHRRRLEFTENSFEHMNLSLLYNYYYYGLNLTPGWIFSPALGQVQELPTFLYSSHWMKELIISVPS